MSANSLSGRWTQAPRTGCCPDIRQPRHSSKKLVARGGIEPPLLYGDTRIFSPLLYRLSYLAMPVRGPRIRRAAPLEGQEELSDYRPTMRGRFTPGNWRVAGGPARPAASRVDRSTGALTRALKRFETGVSRRHALCSLTAEVRQDYSEVLRDRRNRFDQPHSRSVSTPIQGICMIDGAVLSTSESPWEARPRA